MSLTDSTNRIPEMNKDIQSRTTNYTINSNTHELPVSVQIGKQGLSQTVLDEIKKHLKKRKLIKIKCLRYFLSTFASEEGETSSHTNTQKMKLVAQILEAQLGAHVVSITGFTIVLWHKKV